MNAPRTLAIESVVRESSRHVTIAFRDPSIPSYEPGQFVMVWVPGVDEVPMALWGGGQEPLKITVEAKGDCTRVLCSMNPGHRIGIRGPYGKGFRARGSKILAVVGGTGTVPLVPFCERARARGAQVDVVLGARSKEFLLLRRPFERTGAKVHVSTDDGTDGFHGRAPDLAAELLSKSKYDEVVTCGPERMMKAMAGWCKKYRLPLQASLERWMKCAVGICDACLVDGIRLCRDGPVLEGNTLANCRDFGAFERDPSGLRRPIP